MSAITIGPQPGPQTDFLRTAADIAIYGGAAGGGKTFGMLLNPIKHQHRSGFRGIIFRKYSTHIRNPGGLWDESRKIYPHLQAIGASSTLTWTFPSEAVLKFGHLESDQTAEEHQGSQYSMIGFEELTHFSAFQFWYMFSRNRSATAGHRPYIRCTCNPDPDHFCRRLIDWWIDNDTGLAIKERAGKLRWFIRPNEELVWADSREALVAQYGEAVQPKSLTFIPALVSDNKILLREDPNYMSNLLALPKVDRERLLGGNWNARATAGSVFQKAWFEIVDSSPPSPNKIRYWDRAATVPGPQNQDPDYTAGLKLSRAEDGLFYVEDMVRFRGTSATVIDTIKNTASQDGVSCQVGIEQDPGQSGKFEFNYYLRALAGYNVRAYPAKGDKGTRAKPASAQAQHKQIKIVRGKWNDDFLTELENFSPDGGQVGHDDQVDALSGAFNAMFAPRKILIA